MSDWDDPYAAPCQFWDPLDDPQFDSRATGPVISFFWDTQSVVPLGIDWRWLKSHSREVWNHWPSFDPHRRHGNASFGQPRAAGGSLSFIDASSMLFCSNLSLRFDRIYSKNKLQIGLCLGIERDTSAICDFWWWTISWLITTTKSCNWTRFWTEDSILFHYFPQFLGCKLLHDPQPFRLEHNGITMGIIHWTATWWTSGGIALDLRLGFHASLPNPTGREAETMDGLQDDIPLPASDWRYQFAGAEIQDLQVIVKS